MGNQAVQKINPCSQKIGKNQNYEKERSQSKISQNLKFQRTKSQNLQSSVPKWSQSKVLKLNSLQNQESFSTSDDSKIEEIKVPICSPEIISESPQIQQRQHEISKEDNYFTTKKIFIFDWDDTLFFSSHLRQQKCSLNKSNIDEKILQKLDQTVTRILEACLEIGEVCIVTNSKEGWVGHSSNIFLPKTSSTIFQSGKIRVISSRPKVQQFHWCPGLKKWKYRSFRVILQEIKSNCAKASYKSTNLHLICIGDSQEQIDASNQIYEEYGGYFRNLYVKTIKLQDFPNIDDLLEEQQLFLSKLKMIADMDKKLVIRLQRPQHSKKTQEK